MLQKKNIKEYVFFTLLLLMLFLLINSCEADKQKLQLTINEAESMLDIEYFLIPPPPQVVQNSHKKIKRTSVVLITSGYVTNLGDEEIRKYYDKVLKEHDWQFYEEKKIKNGGNYAGIAAHYTKGELFATVEYYGNSSNYDYGCTYKFDMHWGIPAEAL